MEREKAKEIIEQTLDCIRKSGIEPAEFFEKYEKRLPIELTCLRSRTYWDLKWPELRDIFAALSVAEVKVEEIDASSWLKRFPGWVIKISDYNYVTFENMQKLGLLDLIGVSQDFPMNNHVVFESSQDAEYICDRIKQNRGYKHVSAVEVRSASRIRCIAPHLNMALWV